ncbi:MAG TPA: polysaccharide biosynthesis protein, partial [Thermodesulfobacteriota bacterium]|nr:polysaccharide biosynthesis protein [Thermodesulfobacteriota bacterium]
MAFFYHYKLYWGIWRYVSMGDIINILKAVTLSSAFFTMGVLVHFMPTFPRSIIFIDWLICLLLVGGVRLLIRAFKESGQKSKDEIAKRALIIGAGDAGERLVREINKNFSLNYKFVGFLDDDLRKQGMYIHGIPVIGKVNELPEICKEKNIKEVIVAIPSATGKQMQRILELSRKAEVRFKTVPSLKEIIGENKKISQVRDVELKDLLGRQEIKLDLEKIKDELYGKRIMITGAGGSIGSELARQIAAFQPEIL